MCGINAIYRYTRISDEDCARIRKMNQEMIYRGPDDEGIFSDDQVALGMRRLSIIGVDNGRQPLVNEDGRLVLVCNGEIYNCKELRHRLEESGHRFRSDSDCEVIVHLYEEKGTDCLHDLRGMFAFTLWDTTRKQLLAARDPVGIKPLYFAQIPTGIVFSSELKAISNHALQSTDPDFNIIRELMEFTYPVDMRRTFIKQVQRMLPGEFAIVDNAGVRLQKYWKASYEPTYTGSIQNAQEDVLNVLKESIDLRFQSEVPVAVMLSGGIDSSAVAALSAASQREVHAITVGYAGHHLCDERENAKNLADASNIIWHEIELDTEDFETFFDEYTAVIDEPVADPVCIPQWGIYKKAGDLGFKVLLNGTGGDELFFGYPYHNITARQLEVKNVLDRQLPIDEKNASEFGQYFSSEFYRFSQMNRFLFQNPIDYLKPFDNYWKSLDMNWPDKMEYRYANPLDAYLHEADNGLDQLSAILFSTWLPGNCLHISDKLGMGHGIEVRVPFLDHKLVELVFSLPVTWRYSDDTPKNFLKQMLRGIVADSILDAPKKGFTTPDRFLEHIVNTYTPRALPIKKHRHFHTVLIDKVLSEYFDNIEVAKNDNSVSDFKTYTETSIQIGEDFFSAGNNPAALETFMDVYKKAPHCSVVCNNIGVVYWTMGDDVNALEFFLKSLASDIGNRDAVLNCGTILKDLGRSDEAISIYQRYLSIHHDDTEVRSHLNESMAVGPILD